MDDQYRTIKDSSSGLFKDRGSKFIAISRPVSNPEEAKQALEEIKKKYHDARHHCFAYRTGTGEYEWRVNDDGEPSGTAGKPIMGQIRSFNLTNLIIVVVRYFGGTLLGTGGLINAYRSAAKDSLENAVIVSKTIDYTYKLDFPYAAMNDVMSMIKEENLEQSHQVFELDCTLKIHFRASLEEKIIRRLKIIDKLNYERVDH